MWIFRLLVNPDLTLEWVLISLFQSKNVNNNLFSFFWYCRDVSSGIFPALFITFCRRVQIPQLHVYLTTRLFYEVKNWSKKHVNMLLKHTKFTIMKNWHYYKRFWWLPKRIIHRKGSRMWWKNRKKIFF